MYLEGSRKRVPSSVLPKDPEELRDKRVLLRRGGALGDVLFVASMAATIRSQQKRCQIVFACPEWIMPLVRRIREIDTVISCKEALRIKVWESFDFLLDFAGVLERNERASYVDYFSLHKERIGIEKWPLIFPTFSFPKGSRNYIAIHVGGSNIKKKWPISYWAALLQELDKKKILYVLLGDGGDDHPECSDSARDLIGSTDLEEACKIVFGSSMLVGTDSGLLHFAGMAGIPSFSLWGAFNPRLTLPYYRDARSLQGKAECAPCSVLAPEACKNNFRCMTSLRPDYIISKVWNHPAISKAIQRERSVISVAPAATGKMFKVDVVRYFKGEKVDKFVDAKIDVSILIPNKRTAKFLPRLFTTLKENSIDVKFETVLCTDGDKAYLKSGDKEVVLSHTVGYAGANNYAFKAASKQSEFICLLNADIEVEENWLAPLVEYLRANPKAGIVGCAQYKFSGKIESLGSKWDWPSCHFPHIGYGQREHPDQNEVREREMITFSSVLMRRRVWEDVGGLDEAYVSGYWEDTDFCMKARQKGWKIYCVPQSRVKHHVGGSKAFVRGGRAQTKAIFKRRWVDTGLVDKYRAEMGVRHNKDRIVAGYIVLNEEEFIQASLESIYDFVDKIIIVEGGNQYAIKAGWCDESRRSTDSTVERIEAFPDPEQKIELIQGEWDTKVDQRNAYAEKLNHGDWLLLMDGDEVFLDKGIWRLSALMHYYDILMPGFYLFWNNFRTLGTSVWEDFLQVKAVHWKDGFHYVNHNYPSDEKGKSIVHAGHYKKWRSSAERLYCHYSWVKPLEKLRVKAEYYRHQKGHPPVIANYIDKVFLGWRRDPKMIEKKFGTHLYGAGETAQFMVKHPEAIQKRLNAGEFDWD